MTKYQIKILLTNKTTKELNKIKKSMQITGTYLKVELIDELVASLIAYEVTENMEFTEEQINSMCMKTLDNIIDEINTTSASECAVTELDDRDFSTNNTEEVVNMTTTINTQNASLIINKVFAKLTSEQNKVDDNGKRVHAFNERPSNILKIVLDELRQSDRIIDIAYILTFGQPQGQEDYRGTCQYSNEQILSEYDKEQNARRDFAINNAMMCKPPSIAQLSALAKCIEIVSNVPELIEVLEELKDTECSLSATSLDVKMAIEKGYNSLSNTKPTKGQIKFMDSIVASGISYGNNVPNTYGKARDFITNSMPLFNRKCLVRDLQAQGVKGLELSTIESFDDNKVKDYVYKAKKLANVLGMTFSYYKENIWTLIDKLSSAKPSELLNIQRACMTKNEEVILEELARMK